MCLTPRLGAPKKRLLTFKPPGVERVGEMVRPLPLRSGVAEGEAGGTKEKIGSWVIYSGRTHEHT